MLDHLLAEAKAAGLQRLSLETGVQPTFVAARALYYKAGFEDCPPFEGYSVGPELGLHDAQPCVAANPAANRLNAAP